MKAIFLAVFIVAVSATPLPKDNHALGIIVNKVPDGAALEVSNLVDIKLKEHADGAVVATDHLHPYSAVGNSEAQAAAATASSNSNEVSVFDNENSMARFLHSMPEVVIVIPTPENPQHILKSELLPVPALQLNNGKAFNDGLVKVQYNGPEDPGIMATLQDWLNVVVKYFISSSSPAASVAPASSLQPRH